VKNQYFGDTRDLFKYDLALRVIEGSPSIRAFTFLPMLTPDDGTNQGSRVDHRRAAAGFHNHALVRHLEECVREGRRDIREVIPCFGRGGSRVHLHGGRFTHGQRASYFRSVPGPWLRDALVLLDPDVGLQVSRPTGKHLLLTEVGDLLSRMTGSSVLMVFQYFPRVSRALYLERRIRELDGIAPLGTAAIADSLVAFFFIARERGIMGRVEEVLAGYREEYRTLRLAP
jgi:hypothetical protein